MSCDIDCFTLTPDEARNKCALWYQLAALDAGWLPPSCEQFIYGLTDICGIRGPGLYVSCRSGVPHTLFGMANWVRTEVDGRTGVKRCTLIWKGHLAPQLGALVGVRFLNLNVGIPPECDKIQWIGGNLTGSLPLEWSQLRYLRSISIPGNRIRGTLPPQWGQMASLKFLNLSGNQLEGPIPASWGVILTDMLLDLSHNIGIDGPLPALHIPKDAKDKWPLWNLNATGMDTLALREGHSSLCNTIMEVASGLTVIGNNRTQFFGGGGLYFLTEELRRRNMTYALDSTEAWWCGKYSMVHPIAGWSLLLGLLLVVMVSRWWVYKRAQTQK